MESGAFDIQRSLCKLRHNSIPDRDGLCYAKTHFFGMLQKLTPWRQEKRELKPVCYFTYKDFCQRLANLAVN